MYNWIRTWTLCAYGAVSNWRDRQCVRSRFAGTSCQFITQHPSHTYLGAAYSVIWTPLNCHRKRNVFPFLQAFPVPQPRTIIICVLHGNLLFSNLALGTHSSIIWNNTRYVHCIRNHDCICGDTIFILVAHIEHNSSSRFFRDIVSCDKDTCSSDSILLGSRFSHNP